MVNPKRMGLKAGCTIRRKHPERLCFLGGAAQAFAAIAGFAALYLAWKMLGSPTQATVYLMLSLAGVISVAALATHWTQTALANHLNILDLALNTTPDAQMILAGNGRMVYANLAFDQLFPGRSVSPLDRIKCSVAADPESISEFLRLRTRATAGVRTTVAVSLRDAHGSAVGRFNISASPINGRPGYSFWNIRDITARSEAEMVIRDERDRLADFFDNAPIGFYSVDGGGRLRFVNQTLAQWLGTIPS